MPSRDPATTSSSPSRMTSSATGTRTAERGSPAWRDGLEESAAHLGRAARYGLTGSAELHNKLGQVLVSLGRGDEADGEQGVQVHPESEQRDQREDGTGRAIAGVPLKEDERGRQEQVGGKLRAQEEPLLRREDGEQDDHQTGWRSPRMAIGLPIMRMKQAVPKSMSARFLALRQSGKSH